MGLDIYLEWEGMTEEERKARYTGYANAGAAGYLRSSYNDSGFDSWADRMLKSGGYYEIFAYDSKKEQIAKDEDGEESARFYPDWDASEARAKKLLERALLLPKVRLFRVSPILSGRGLPRPGDILPIYEKEASKKVTNGFGWYSNASGEFFVEEPPTVTAAIWAQGFRGPDLYLVSPDENANDYYIESLRECLKFIAKGREKNGWLHWSG